MLQRATAAGAEMGTERRDARGAGANDRRYARDLERRLLPQRRDGDRSPGSAPSTKIALPSTRASPRPSWSSEVIEAAAMPKKGAAAGPSLRGIRGACRGAHCTGDG
jgi:hypothetical protein